MDVYTCIAKRRSIRSYLDKPVSQKQLSKILDAAHFAPSSRNIQNWRFIAVASLQTKEKIAQACSSQLWMAEAPTLIIVCSENTNLKLQYPKKWKKFSAQNCAAAVQNILLQAYELGLSSCWVAPNNSLRLKNILRIPDNVEIEAIIPIGYSNEKPISKRHRIEELTFFETYNNRERSLSIFPLTKYLSKLRKH